ncbi:MAG: AmmeMemoRadiSam system radical SAM enzyme [Gemmatimonadales bacterium]|nr:AmmeMemoRadiSam system radical SAM enzyme [Gemmatimonadales bacterium]NIN11167.1 AmmeMemoRadiSam system radical SAM enzyme [Gemmatimonadales bacterium]NIN49766.1 AmmeMemoRadiSam system radical SAM enzyme [Gemmatimonadales bacterium]NIP07230.1 AmmeMemoRadiSam system radical SAM enzyme [Gemmatimonadales bacterium]NIR00443.1 AmmeMemoRadiSam system radical SAM enzyme [Gemmatimonadales bacterium]
MKSAAHLFQKLDDGAVCCGTCQRRCVIPQNRLGWCGTRGNEGGTLYSLIYGEVSSVSINPIEKKPVFHFYPGSRWLSLGSVGCNFRCPGCQNWELSHWTRGGMGTRYLSPEDSVAMAKATGCTGLSWTFNEPTIWYEYTVDSAKAAKQEGLYTNYVTNGSITQEALAAIAPFLDVFRVDVKGFFDATYKRIGHVEQAEQILRVVHQARTHGMHVEVVTNIIPGCNDSDVELQSIARWIRDTLGPQTPWHVTRFFPHLRLTHLQPTSIERLETARTIGTETGLWYVYLGNVPGHLWENTYCHTCGELLIQRDVFEIVRDRVKHGTCPACGERIPGTF